MTLFFSLFIVTGVAQCRVHTDCRNTEQCHSGSCIDACRIEQCGTNAICTSRDHRSTCACPPGYTGDARVACIPSKRFFARILLNVLCIFQCFFQSPLLLWMSSLAAAWIVNVLNMQLASIKHVATLVQFLTLVLPMLFAKLFSILQNVLAQQDTLEILKCNVFYLHVRKVFSFRITY